MSPRLSVFLPSHNKGGFAVEAVRSVFGQDYEDWELWLLENSTDEGRTRRILRKFTDLDDPRVHYEEIELESEIRDSHAPCPYLLNRYYPRANGDIILYLSDDDLFMPGIFRSVVSYFDEHPEHDALYFHLARTIASAPGQGLNWNARFQSIPADVPRGAGELDCQVDGGQVAYRRHVLETVGQPYFYAGNDCELAHHADGLHLEAVARAGFTFQPLPLPGVIHRHAPSSTWTRL